LWEGLRFKLGWVGVEDEKRAKRNTLEMDAEVESGEGEGGVTDVGTAVAEQTGLKSKNGGEKGQGDYYHCYEGRREGTRVLEGA
jgi:hypothetical protein